MFILDTNDIGTTLFAKGQKVKSDTDIWHKRIGHINYQRLQELETKQVVFDFPKFSGRKAQICEAYQLGQPKFVKPESEQPRFDPFRHKT